MEGAIAKTKKEVIHLKNGYFKLELTGVVSVANRANWAGRSNSSFKFLLPPLNEMGFSDHYNQSLIKIRRAEWGNIDGLAFNCVPCAPGGATTDQRVHLHTNIPTRNQILIHNNGNFFDGSELRLSNLQTPLYLKYKANYLTIPGGADGLTGNEFQGSSVITEYGNTNPLAVDAGQTNGAGGGTEAAVALEAGGEGNTKKSFERTNNGWCVDNSGTSIFDDGILCGNPFGKEVSFEVRDQYDNNVLGITGGTDTATFNKAHLRVELEIQLLPNP